jgi:hypothetical protein
VIKSKSIRCSFFADNTLLDDCIGRMATKHSYSQLMQKFDSEESFDMKCVELVHCHYIFHALDLLENDASRPMPRDEYFMIFKNARMIQR